MLQRIKQLLQSTALYRLYLRLVKRYRFWVQDRQYPAIYRRAAKQPVDAKKVLFFESSRPVLSNSFSVMFQRLEKGGYDLHCHFLLHTTASRKEQRKTCRAFFRDLATAKVLFLDEGTDLLSHIPVRPETKVVQLWHGCGAFKKFGRSTAEKSFGASGEYMDTHPFHRHYDLVTVSSPAVVWAYEEAMDIPHESGIVQPTGVSRTDVFFDPVFLAEAREAVFSAVPQAKGKKILLYAPTFRGEIMDAHAPDQLDLSALCAALSDRFVLLLKQHPHVKHRPVIPDDSRNFAFDVTDSLSIEELLCAADICISDYSSLIFEYSLFEKPMLFLAHDLENFFDWRGFYYDYNELAPGPIVSNTTGVIDFIKHIDERFDRERVHEFRKKFMRSCDGHATERIMLDAFGKEALDQHRRSEPLEDLPYHDIPHSNDYTEPEEEDEEEDETADETKKDAQE